MSQHEELSEWRSAWWDERLTNWALWKGGAGSCGLGLAIDGEWGGDSTRPPPPLVGEALDTDRLVLRLPMLLHDAVCAYYLWTGTMEARALDLHIHRNTLTNRVGAAKRLLDAMWWTKKAGESAALAR